VHDLHLDSQQRGSSAEELAKPFFDVDSRHLEPQRRKGHRRVSPSGAELQPPSRRRRVNPPQECAHRVEVLGEEILLTALEFRLLMDLVSRAGRVQSRDALLERVWGYAPEVETRTVDTHVKRLREKLGSSAKHIETVRGVGYRALKS
jgi:DNA-binding response OmpR family regulator